MMRLALFLFLVSQIAFASGGSYGGGGGGGGGAVWGAITGTLSSQTDLNTALGLKAPLASPTFTGLVDLPIGLATSPSLGFGSGANNTLPGISVSANQGVLQFSVQNQSSGLAQEYMFLSQNNLGTPKNIFLNDYPTGTTANNFICASNDGDTLTITGNDSAATNQGGAITLGGLSSGTTTFYNAGTQSGSIDATQNWTLGTSTSLVTVSNALALTSPQTTLTGSVGTTLCSEPNQGSSYKKVVCYLSGYSTVSQTYTYPTAFSHTPYIYGLPGAVAVAGSNTTTLTFTNAVTLTGFLFLEGY